MILRNRPSPHPGGPSGVPESGEAPSVAGWRGWEAAPTPPHVPAATRRPCARARLPIIHRGPSSWAFLKGGNQGRRLRATGTGAAAQRGKGAGVSWQSRDLGPGDCSGPKAQFGRQGRPRRGLLETRPRASGRAASLQKPWVAEPPGAREGWSRGDQEFRISHQRRRSPESEPCLQVRPESPLVYCSTFGNSRLGRVLLSQPRPTSHLPAGTKGMPAGPGGAGGGGEESWRQRPL